MSFGADPNVVRIERAAFQLRRLWTKSDLLRRLREQDDGARQLQLSTLLVIYAIARQGGEVTVGAVADYLDVDPSTASRLVGQAITAGYVSRRPSAADARRVHLRLTRSGERVREMTDEFRLRLVSELVADWTDGEREQFGRLLARFADAVANVPAAAVRPEQAPEAVPDADE